MNSPNLHDRRLSRNDLADASNLSLAQLRIWLGQKLNPETPLYNMALAFRIDGPLDPERFQRALVAVMEENDALRSVVCEHDDVPRLEFRSTLSDVHEFVDMSGISDQEIDAWIVERSQSRFQLDVRMMDSVLAMVDQNRWIWFLNQHHLTTDAWATSLVFERMSEKYTQAASGSPVPSVSYPQFAEFLKHEASLRNSDRFNTLYQFWENTNGTSRPLTLFAAKRSDSSNRRFSTAFGEERMHRFLEVTERPGIRGLTPQLTQLNVFLTIYFAWLHRITGETDLSIGTPIHSRSTPDQRATIGLFIELYPVRLTINDGETYAELLSAVTTRTMELFSKAMPGCSTALDRTSFGAVLNFITASYGDFAGLPTAPKWIHPQHVDPDHPVRLHVHDLAASGGLQLDIDLNTEALKVTRHAWVADQFLALFDSFLENPDGRISDADNIGTDELQFLHEFDRHDSVTDASSTTVVDSFRIQAQASPESIAIRQGDMECSYRQLDEFSDAVVRRLRRLNVSAGTCVGILVPRSIEMLYGMIGILKSGAAFVPIDPSYPDERVRTIVQEADIGILLTTDLAASEKSLQFVDEVIDLKSITADKDVAVMEDGPRLDDLAYVMYTSGSTGTPKGVQIDHQSLAEYLAFAKATYAQDEPCDMPLFTSYCFDLTITSLFVPLISGGTIHVYNEGDRAADTSVVQVFKDDRVDVVKLTPSHLSLVTDLDLTKSRIRTLILGGEDLRTDLAKKTLAAFGNDIEILNEYGPTEATVGCMIHRFASENDKSASVPIGVPMPHCEIVVVDDHRKRVPVGVTGEIYIGGRCVARGYHRQSELTNERFVVLPEFNQRFYRTGDFGHWRSSGLLHFEGRKDEQVKIGGVRVELSEVEAVLVAHHGVTDCVVDTEVYHPRMKSVSETDTNCLKCGISESHVDVKSMENGICNICLEFEGLKKVAEDYFRSEHDLQAIIDNMVTPSGQQYNCMMLLSGGKDSTYALYKIAEMGANPYVFSLDNGFISDGAKENMRRAVEDLGLPLEFATTPAMNQIFVESLRRFSNVCNGCFKTIYTLAINRAHALGIKHIVTGLSRGQIFETRISEFFRNGVLDVAEIDRGIIEARRAYHRAGDIVSKQLDVSLFQSDDVFESIQFVDFFRYCDVELETMRTFLRDKAPWTRPDDTGRSTNCLINAAGIFVHKRDRGFHNYEAPYSWDVRLGHKTRDEAMEELDDDLDPTSIYEMLNEIDYDIDWRKKEVASKRLVAYYVASGDVDPMEIDRHMRSSLPPNIVPTMLRKVDSIPLTANGKVDREALRSTSAVDKDVRIENRTPRNSTERLLAEIWADVFALPKVGIDDDFFELGGDSILNVQIIAKANKAGLEITPANLFDNPTIANLAAVARTIENSAVTAAQKPTNKTEFSLSGLSRESLEKLQSRFK